MTGRVALVTGANSGIGYEVARCLCEDGHDVVLGCRNLDKGALAAAKIRWEQPGALVSCMQLDLSDMQSVRDFVTRFCREKRKLHMLVNNAGLLLAYSDCTRYTTSQGLELTMATNFLGHFLLTHLLLDLLKAAAAHTGDARIVNVSSALHDSRHHIPGVPNTKEIDVEDLMYDRESGYSAMQAYKDSKLCLVLMTYRLAELLKNDGVTVSVTHPGFLPQTALSRRYPACYRGMAVCCFHWLCRCCRITRTSRQAGEALAALAANDRFLGVSGKYYVGSDESRSSLESYDVDTQCEVYRAAARLVQLGQQEVLDT